MPVHIKINGELFSYWKGSLTKSKANAQRLAKEFHKRGYKVRVKSEQSGGQVYYGLWVRKR